MPRYFLSDRASRRLQEFPKDVVSKILAKLESFPATGLPPGSRKYKEGGKAYPVFYIRSGSYRIFYVWEGQSAHVLDIQPRQGAYGKKSKGGKKRRKGRRG